MWKTPVLLRAATDFFPQALCEFFHRIQQAMWTKFFAAVFNRKFYQQNKILWKKDMSYEI
jgi:hypothetical protein